MRGRAGQPADPGPVAAPDRRHHGRQGRPRQRHHRRRLPGAGRRGAVDRGQDPQHGNVLLPAAADGRGAPARSAGQRPDVHHPRPAHPGRADRPVRHRVRPGPRPAHGLSRRTAARGGLLDPAGDRPRPGQAVLARPGTPPSRHQLAPPFPGGSGRLETADHPEDAAGQRRRPRRPRGPRRPTPCSPSARSTSTSPSGPSTTRPGGPSGRHPARSGPRRSRTPRNCPAARRGWTSGPASGCRSCPPWSGPPPPNGTPRRHGWPPARRHGPARRSPPAGRNCAGRSWPRGKPPGPGPRTRQTAAAAT